MNPRLRAAALAALVLLCGSPSLQAMDTDRDSVPDDLDALPCDPLASQVAFAPAKDAFGMVMFEDLWPVKGDADFNDSIIAYNYVLELASDGRMVGLQGTFSVLALGASVHNGIYLGLPLPASTAVTATLASGGGSATALVPVAGESNLVFRLAADGHQLFGVQSGTINTQTNQTSRAAQTLTLVLRFGSAQSISPALAPFDLYLQRTLVAGHQIHRPEYGGTNTANQSLFGTAQDGSTPTRHYVDSQGLPFALNVPVIIRWPLEGVSIDKAYPDILAFGSSGGATHADWYLTHLNTAALWSGSPVPVAGPVASWPLIDTSCLNVWKGTIEYGGTIDTVPLANKVDAAGNVYSTGYRYANGENSFLAKFSPSGTQLWIKDFTSSASNGQAYPSGLAVDAQGNLFTTGYTYGTFGGASRQNSNGYADLFISKFDSSGNLIWNRQLGARYGAFGVDLVSDGAGGAYAVGYSNGDFNGCPVTFPIISPFCVNYIYAVEVLCFDRLS